MIHCALVIYGLFVPGCFSAEDLNTNYASKQGVSSSLGEFKQSSTLKINELMLSFRMRTFLFIYHPLYCNSIFPFFGSLTEAQLVLGTFWRNPYLIINKRVPLSWTKERSTTTASIWTLSFSAAGTGSFPKTAFLYATTAMHEPINARLSAEKRNWTALT